MACGALDAPLPRRATVLAVSAPAVYLSGERLPAPAVVGLVTADAVRLPYALVVDARRHRRPFAGIRPGDEALIGAGRVEIPGRLRVRVAARRREARTIAPLPVDRVAEGVAALGRRAGTAGGGLSGEEVLAVLQGACDRGDAAAVAALVPRLVGLGPGLTPSGDDVLAGVLVALRLLGPACSSPRAPVLADAIDAAVARCAPRGTTALSAALLWCAARGHAAPEVVAVLDGVAGRGALGPAVRRLLVLGHTSGADLLTGVLAGCRAVLASLSPVSGPGMIA